MIFVEGQAERLLVPEFITNRFKGLSKRYLSLLEISGAHTHKYKALVEKLGVVTLVITDLDSRDAGKKKCAPKKGENQTTSNHTLKSWHPKKDMIDDLVVLPKDASDSKNPTAPLFVAYQKTVKLGKKEVLSRTFEDALILANFDDPFFEKITAISNSKDAFVGPSQPLEISLFAYVQTLTKGDFAFNCLFHIAEDSRHSFNPPKYINEGLEWLQSELSPGLSKTL